MTPAHPLSAGEFFLSAWDFHPSIVVGCLLLLALYLFATDFRLDRKTALFFAGVSAMFLALVSPLDTLSDDYLFSAHMLQHLILLLATPPLLLLGIPRELAEAMLRPRWTKEIEAVLGRAPVAWIIGNVALWLWHLPLLYNAALASENVHIFEHLCFLVSATIFWWPVLAPIDALRLAAPSGLAYLILGYLSNSLLGITFTFASVGLYPAYLQPADEIGILPLLRDQWGLSPQSDQQLGGLLMWVGASPVFLAAVLQVVARFFRESDGTLAVDSQPAPLAR